MDGPGIDGENTEVSAARRLEDYLADSRYPVNSRPAGEDTPTDLTKWPGLPPTKSDSAQIRAYAGEQLRDGSLFVDIAVDVREAGRYSFFTVLRESTTGRALAISTVTRDLVVGETRVSFEFYGLVLRETAAAPADAAEKFVIPAVGGERIPNDFELEELMMGKRETSPAGRLAFLQEMHTTAAYKSGQFTNRVWDGPEKRARIAELEAEVLAEAAIQDNAKDE